MNVVTKGVLTAMTLALDFAAGNALDQLWDRNWSDDALQVSNTAGAGFTATLERTDIGKPQTGGGVCKPTELSVMVMAIEATPAGGKALPRHVCIRAMAGEPDFSDAFEIAPVGKAEK